MLEFTHKAQDINQQRREGVFRIMNCGAKLELHATFSQLRNYASGIGKRPGKTVELCDDQGVTFTHGGQSFPKPRPVTFGQSP